MLREKRKFTPTEDRILAYLTAPKNTGDLVNHLCPANLVVIHRSLDRLEKEGWIKPHPGYDFVPVPGKNWPDVIFLEPRGQYWQQANNDPAAAYYWTWETEGPNSVGIVAYSRTGGDGRPMPDMFTMQQLIEVVEHFRHKTWFTVGDEQALIALWRKHYEPAIGTAEKEAC